MVSGEIIFGIIMGLVVAWFVEKIYIERIGVLPNAMAIYFVLNPYWPDIPDPVKYWVYIGIGLGVFALIFLLKKWKFSLYGITYPFYSGKTIMGIYITYIVFKEYSPEQLFSELFWIAVVLAIISMWYIGIKYFKNNVPFKT